MAANGKVTKDHSSPKDYTQLVDACPVPTCWPKWFPCWRQVGSVGWSKWQEWPQVTSLQKRLSPLIPSCTNGSVATMSIRCCPVGCNTMTRCEGNLQVDTRRTRFLYIGIGQAFDGPWKLQGCLCRSESLAIAQVWTVWTMNSSFWFFRSTWATLQETLLLGNVPRKHWQRGNISSSEELPRASGSNPAVQHLVNLT
jgi:hypothetical protein